MITCTRRSDEGEVELDARVYLGVLGVRGVSHVDEAGLGNVALGYLCYTLARRSFVLVVGKVDDIQLTAAGMLLNISIIGGLATNSKIEFASKHSSHPSGESTKSALCDIDWIVLSNLYELGCFQYELDETDF